MLRVASVSILILLDVVMILAGGIVSFIVDILATYTNFENKTVPDGTRSVVYQESACTVL